MINYFLKAIQKPSLFISIFILFELFPVYFLGLKNDRDLIEDKKSIVNVLYKEEGKGLTLVVKERKLSLTGSTEKYMFFNDHSDSSKIVIPKNKIISITSDKRQSLFKERVYVSEIISKSQLRK